jgi:hypothetical protein
MRIVDECVHCTWNGLLIHDFAVAQAGHFECLTFEGGTDVTIENSEFRSCAIFSIFAKPSGTINGALIQNNVFWNPRNFFQSNEIKFTSDGTTRCSNVVIRYNVISDDVNEDCGETSVVGNIQLARQASCGSGWDYNIFVNAEPCGSHARRVSDAQFVNAAAGNFHLEPTSPAIGRGSPSDYPKRDKGGRARPAGGLPDAGSFEAPPPPRPAGVPSHVPRWALALERWLATPRADRDIRPAGVPRRLPPWFVRWRSWRVRLAHS